MILKDNIQTLVGNHVAPYIYNAKNFEPGKTFIYYSGPYWDNKEIDEPLHMPNGSGRYFAQLLWQSVPDRAVELLDLG